MYQKLLTLLNSTIALLLTSFRYYYFIRWTILYDESDLIVCVLFEQVFVNVSSDLRNVDTWVPPHHRLPVWSHQKLFKVPLDVVDLQRPPEQPVVGVTKVVSNWRAGVLKEGENLLLVFSIHITFLKQQEVWNKSIAWSNML